MIHATLEAIQSSALARLITSPQWSVTANSKQILETLHFVAFALAIGCVMVMCMRLLGLGRRTAIAALRGPVLRTAWLAFAVVLVTGALQFVPIAAEVFYRPSFRGKMAVLGLALISLVALQARITRSAAAWDAGAAITLSTRVLAGLSLVLWPTVIVVARLMYAFEQMTPR